MRLIKKIIAVVQLLAVATLVMVSVASAVEHVPQAEQEQSQVFEGVLIDRQGFLAGKVEGRTVEDLGKIGPAAVFGIALKQKDGSFRFFRFDENGQSQTVEVLKNYPAGELLRVTVVGVPSGETINVVTVTEKLDEKRYVGVLVDKKDFDLSNGNPAGITRESLLATDRIASGYGVAVKQPDGRYSYLKLDDNSQISASEIIAATTKERNISVIAHGTWNGSLLLVSSLVEIVE